MESNKKQKKCAKILKQYCVACGCCERVCPRSAIKVQDGVCAKVNNQLCVGCGLCLKACPASVITLEVLS